MSKGFNFKVQSELKGIDVRVVVEETTLDKIIEESYLGLTPFGYEKEWFFIEFEEMPKVNTDNINEIIEYLNTLFSRDYQVEVSFNETIDVSETPKVEVYYAVNNDGPIEDENSEVTMSVATKYDYEVNGIFEISTNKRLLAYTHNLFDVGECFESHLEIYDLKFLKEIPQENNYFMFIHNNDLQTYSED